MERLLAIGLVAVAGLALWLLLGSGRLFGIDLGAFGMTLLVATAWGAMALLARMPADGSPRSASPGEWQAWIGFGFMAVATLYFLARLYGAGDGLVAGAPGARGLARDLVLLLVAWVVLSQVVAARWKGRVLADERDQRIEAQAGEWGRIALVFVVLGLAALFGLSPPARLQWATPAMVANLLVFALLWGWLVEHGAMAWMYARDRRETAA
jgi:hypothetical protein